ncbi:PhnD/SsuA/transferrin family substrate-binding protein [Coraliomargarita sp. W4R72]
MSVLRRLGQRLRLAFVTGARSASVSKLRWCGLLFCGLSLLGLGRVHADESPNDVKQVRIILSSESLTDTNLNDATAAFRSWVYEFGKKMKVPVALDAAFLPTNEEISREMDKFPNHLVSLTLPEYLRFDPERFSRNIYLTKLGRSRAISTRYLLLARESGSIQTLGDLKDKTLIQYDHLETNMAQEWLDYLLVDAGQVRSAELLGTYTKGTDLSKAVLGVFFGKIDACIASDRSFDLLCELNPQLRVKLKVIEQSPLIIGGAMFTQSNYDPELEMMISEALVQFGNDASGKQILTLFGAESTYRTDLSELQDSIDLYKKWTSVREEDE